MGDFAVLDFEGSIENKPISEIAPQASKNLHGGKKFWLHLAPENFLPKFSEQLIGLKPGEPRLVIVNFPDEFPVKELAGKKPITRLRCARSRKRCCRRSTMRSRPSSSPAKRSLLFAK
jgi:FKBP-type peptidyl-prolyl cis-trans isomerase (trigger factor)